MNERKPKILVIEDVQSLRKDIIEMLGFEGYDAEGAENGLVGVEKASSFQPDLIICDIMMPGLDGHGVLEALRRQEWTDFAFIFLTARTDREDMRHGMEQGAEDYLTKPFTASELLAAVRVQLEKLEKRRAEKQESVNTITRNIIFSLPHELRTPLNVIMGYSDLLMTADDTFPMERVAEFAQHINLSAMRLYRLFENFLIYAQTILITSDQAQINALRTGITYSPQRIIERAARTKAAHERLSDLQLDLTDIEAVSIAEDHLRRMVEELIDNAFKFSNPGTPVTVTAHPHDHGYQIKIEDRGRGMTPAQIASIGAYMQFDRIIYEQQGAGLGLAIAKRLTELYGGNFSIESEAGSGTRVILTLPSHTPDSADNPLEEKNSAGIIAH
ncbi:MAG: hybrid sensor histidine kinase/response regulator [Phototrophicales bacterium]|nr:MAG: hybrid sensor histidine kinase/response regulator [Phototrophicales bacterium]